MVDRSSISWIVSVQAFFQFGLACFTGSLFDSYGHKPLIAAGTFFLVLGFCMLSLCTQYYQFFLVHATLIAWGSNLL
jgi:MFS family permease